MYAHEPGYGHLPSTSAPHSIAPANVITLRPLGADRQLVTVTSPGLGLTAQEVLGGLSLQTLMIGGLAFWVAYRIFFTSGAKKRRAEIAEARKRHDEEIKAIREKYA